MWFFSPEFLFCLCVMILQSLFSKYTRRGKRTVRSSETERQLLPETCNAGKSQNQQDVSQRAETEREQERESREAERERAREREREHVCFGCSR